MTLSIFDHPLYAPYRSGWAARCGRYQVYRAYYAATIYDRQFAQLHALGGVQGLPLSQALYQGIRTLFSPLRRVVRVDVAKVPGGWRLPEQPGDGRPAASLATRERVAGLRRQLDAGRVYERFTTYGAVAGEAALLLTGRPQAPQVVALRPDEVVQGTLGDGTPFALIVKQVRDATATEYAQVITPDAIETYRDGKLHDYGGGAWRRNAWGFVPLHFAHYVEGEDGCGEPAFGGVLQLLDRVNEMASLTLDVMARNAEPIMVATGVHEVTRQPGDDLLTAANPDAKFYTVDPKLSLQETLQVIQDVRAEYKSNLPQLAIDDLRGRSELAFDTVLTLLMELGDHIVAVRGSVDRAVEGIERWVMAAQGGVPDDYALWRERAWIALTPGQQLALERERLAVEGLRRGVGNSKP